MVCLRVRSIDVICHTALIRRLHSDRRLGMTYFVSFTEQGDVLEGKSGCVGSRLLLNEYGVKTSEAFGMYMIEYAVHKLSIGIMAVILYLLHFHYMNETFAEYEAYIGIGFVATVIITICLLLFCMCRMVPRISLKKLIDSGELQRTIYRKVM